MGKASRRKKEQSQDRLSQSRKAWSDDVRAKTGGSVSAVWARSRTPENVAFILTHAFEAANVNVAGVYQMIADAQRAGHRDMKIDCKKGCGYCCHTEVTVTAPEILTMRTHIDNVFTPEQKQALRDRLSQRNTDSELMSDVEKADSARACPLLVDGSCSVYSARPFYCRSHHSMDVNACKVAAEGRPSTIPVIAEFAGSVFPIVAGLSDAFSASGCNMDPLWLSEALEIALEGEVAEAWCQGGDPFAPSSKKEFEERMA